jgi:hypothetical protein
MWEWFTTKPFVDAGQARFVRHAPLSSFVPAARAHMHDNHAPGFDDDGSVCFFLQIGSVPTPWPSWLIAAHPSPDRAPSHELRTFLEALSTFVVAFDAPENRAGPNVEFIKETFGYPEEDIGVELSLYDGASLVLTWDKL